MTVLSNQPVPFKPNLKWTDPSYIPATGVHRFVDRDEKGIWRCRHCKIPSSDSQEGLCVPTDNVKLRGTCTPGNICESPECPSCGWVVRASR